MRLLDHREKDFNEKLEELLKYLSPDRDPTIVKSVSRIVEAVKKEGDKALLRYARKFDNTHIKIANIEVSREEIESALAQVPAEVLASLQKADDRIKAYHEKQLQVWSLDKGFDFSDELGVKMGQIVKPMERVGIYVPGGKASYPSTVLMSAVPAKVAGVKEVIMVSPQKEREFNPYLLASAGLAGVDRIFRVGGAHAIAALAYGTESIPRVDKIVGPGNAYVTAAKRLLFGVVDIDMIAGPTEVVVISDGCSNPQLVAADLLSQAEHDEDARAIFITTQEWEAKAVCDEVLCQIETTERKEIAEKAIANHGAAVLVSDIEKAVQIVNLIAPEHLEILCKDYQRVLNLVKSAGAVFLGQMTPEAFGDYIAGSNHILPTGGSARFRSPLGVYDFFKRISVIEAGSQALFNLSEDVIRLAKLEGLTAHAHAVEIRSKKGEAK